MAIKSDCDVLKEETDIYLMQGYLNKNSIGLFHVYNHFKNEIIEGNNEYNEDKLIESLEKSNSAIISDLDKILEVNDKQKFKNVLIKSIKASIYPKRTASLIFLLCLLEAIAILLIFWEGKIEPEKKCNLKIVENSIMIFASFLEGIVIPFYILKTVLKKNFFGKEDE